MTGFLILGSHPDIAFEEVQAVLGEGNGTASRTDDVVFIDELNADAWPLAALQDRLGGTVKTGLIAAKVDHQKDLVDTLAGLAVSYRPGEDRLQFGISVYSAGARGKLVALRATVEKFGMQLKSRLKESGRVVRWVTASKIPVLSSVIISKQDLIGKGIEFCLFPGDDGIMIGVTETVQDFELWGERDYGRPARDAARGMLPPKLARMMVNLSLGDPSVHTVLDPYCGVGTALTEAIAVGYTKVIGGDVDTAAIDAVRENIEWEAKRMGIEIIPQIVHAKAESLATFLAPQSADRVVSEVYLGVPRKGYESRLELEQRMDKLVDMYTEGFRALARVVTPDAILVMGFPAYVVEGKIIIAQIVERAKLFGFILDGGPWRYGREKQMVLRDIYRFRRAA
jgi:tRNA G10  N-methylase Trm11